MSDTKTQLRGNCQCCARVQAVLHTGLMAKHGYTVESGWFRGVCSGRSYEPMQVDRSITDMIAEQVRAEAAKMEQTAKSYKVGKSHPSMIKRSSYRPDESPVIEWDKANADEREYGLWIGIQELQNEARSGRFFADQLQAVADRVHGTPLREVVMKPAPVPIFIGESRRSEGGSLLTCTRVVRGSVHWESDSNRSGWCSTRIWRSLPRPGQQAIRSNESGALDQIGSGNDHESRDAPARLHARLVDQIRRDEYEFEDDARYFKRAGITDADLKLRILMERAIVRTAVTDLIAAGYNFEIEDLGLERLSTTKRVMEEIMACDIDTLHAYKFDRRNASIYLVYGNDGYDVIADYSVSLEEALQRANELSDELFDDAHEYRENHRNKPAKPYKGG